MKTLGCIIARTNSKRLPKKVINKTVFNDTSVIEYIINKMKRSKQLDDICLCTSDHPDDTVLIEIAKKNKIKWYAGSQMDVLERLISAAKENDADVIARITGDNIFCDEIFLDISINEFKKGSYQYARITELPSGVTPEIIHLDVLQNCFQGVDNKYSEYLMLYAFNPDKYKCLIIYPEEHHQNPYWTLTIDTQNDLNRTNKILSYSKRLLFYDDVVDIINSQNIPYTQRKAGTSIKLPAQLTFSYKAMLEEMSQRIKKSGTFLIPQGYYSEIKKTYLK